MPSGGNTGVGITGPGNTNNPNNPYTANSQLSPQIQAMLDSGNFNGAFQAAMAQNGGSNPGTSQLQELLTPSALQSAGVNWSPQTEAAYYAALNQNAPAIQKNDQGIIESVGQTVNPQIASGNGGNSQFNGGSFNSTPTIGAGGSYVPNPVGQDYTPQFQNGHMQGALGDVTNAVAGAEPVIADDAIIAGLAYAGGMGGGALAGLGGAGAGTLGAAVGTGIAAGATGAAAGDVVNNQPLTLGSVGKGALIGGATGGLGYAAQPVTGALQDATGLPAPVAAGLTKGAIGAGVGAGIGALNGTGASNGAITGGIGGATSGALGSAAGNPQLGQVGGTIAGTLAGKYLTSPVTTSAPTTPAVSGTPAASTTPTLPAPSIGQQQTPQVGGTQSSGTVGLGYAPRSQTDYSNIDFSNYGQGPEANFFTSTANPSPYPQNIGPYSGYTSPPPTATTQPVPTSPQQRI